MDLVEEIREDACFCNEYYKRKMVQYHDLHGKEQCFGVGDLM